ncbi:uncharacterized protein LOC124437002 isoform X2 [Xenia sp. Carnegie-2017]|uniref:uncharacterized protein LOC124437002 isoform X2 n=1 Tax=Xenia sp. Carnegie-2017 TaxID=2897299 RepID=UPI001F04F2C7|nr:uncharacterized protein LOC124437002 isoform X2 [Xenia sp. Carnegie-2017]
MPFICLFRLSKSCEPGQYLALFLDEACHPCPDKLENCEYQGMDAKECEDSCKKIPLTSIFPSTTTKNFSTTAIDLKSTSRINPTTTIGFNSATSPIHKIRNEIKEQLPGNTSSEMRNRTLAFSTPQRTVTESLSRRGFWKKSWIPLTLAILLVIVVVALGVIRKLFVCKRGKDEQINEPEQNISMISSSDGNQVTLPETTTSDVMDIHENLRNKFFEGSL